MAPRIASWTAAASAALLLAAPAALGQDSRPAAPKLPPLGAPAGSYGGAIDEGPLTALADLMANPDQFKGKTVRVRAPISDVCSQKGCWMVLGEGPQAMRVRFKDYAFFVPRDAGGRVALVQGTAEAKTITEEEARHYAEESGDPESAKAIHGPQQVVAFTATGVEILGRMELPLLADGSPQVLGPLQERIQAGQELRPAGAAVESAEAALAILRELPASRTQEFRLCSEVEGRYVFALPGGDDPFAHGFAVDAANGRVVRY